MSTQNVGLKEALDTLQNRCSVIRDLVYSGKTVPWFGSAISFTRMPGLPVLISSLLELLYKNHQSGNANCPYLATTREILGLVPAGSYVHAETDPKTWDKAAREKLIDDLVGKYSTIMSLSVSSAAGEVSVRWDLLNLIEVYSDPAVEEDAEHRFIALLVREGVWPQSVTTNWDGLIERAYEGFSDGIAPDLFTVASNADLETNGQHSSHLFKIHGCAKKARVDSTNYKPYMVATELEIGEWVDREQTRSIREAVRTLIRTKTILFIGLSGQDFNLKLQAIAASNRSHHYTPSSPKIAFATATISPDHRTFLAAFYTEDGFNEQKVAICEQAAVPLYAKPLLGALWIDLLVSKCRLVLNRASDLRLSSKSETERAIEQINAAVITAFEAQVNAGGLDEAWRWLSRSIPPFISRCITIFRDQKPLHSSCSYSPLIPGDLSSTGADSNLPLMRFHWLLWALGLIVAGSRAGRWQIMACLNGSSNLSPLSIELGGHLRPLYLVNDHIQGKVKCMNNGLLQESTIGDSIIVYPYDCRPNRVSRSPRSTFRFRSAADEPREIWLGDLYHESDSDEDALEALALEIA